MVSTPEWVLEHPVREVATQRLDTALGSEDDVWARELAPGMRQLASILMGINQPCAQRFGQLADALSNRLISDGYDATVRMPTEIADVRLFNEPSEQALYDAMVIRAGSSSPLTEQFCAALEYYGEATLEYYFLEAVMPALLDAAEMTLIRSSNLDVLDGLRDTIRAFPLQRTDMRRYYVVRPEDTLHDIALSIYGDRDLWTQVVENYGLYPPYISDRFLPNCLQMGSRLEVSPLLGQTQEQGLGSTLLTTNTNEEWDIMVQDGEIVTISGLEGFATDLGLRAATPMGDIADTLSYGMPQISGLPSTTDTVIQALLMAETLREDPRVDKVISRAEAARISSVNGLFTDEIVVIPRPELMTG